MCEESEDRREKACKGDKDEAQFQLRKIRKSCDRDNAKSVTDGMKPNTRWLLLKSVAVDVEVDANGSDGCGWWLSK